MPASWYGRMLRLVLGALPLFVIATPTGHAVNRASAASAPILVDTSGKCAKDPTTVGLDSPVCRKTKFGNAVSDDFLIPQGPWGIAWSYRCSRSKSFYVVVHLPTLDGILPLTRVYKRGRHGHGYKMETNKWQSSWDAIPEEFRNPQNLVIDSTCSWHVRVVQGDAAVVAHSVPAVPRTG